MRGFFTRILLAGLGVVAASEAFAVNGRCDQAASNVLPPVMPRQPLEVDFGGLMQIAQVTDATESTGATAFLFPRGARAGVDVGGGSVTSSNTTLIGQGGATNWVDGVVFAGGSTAGGGAAAEVSRQIFQKLRRQGRDHWEAANVIIGAQIFDFGGRQHDGADPDVTPDSETGRALMDNLGQTLQIGRAGAGVSSTANKVDPANIIYGGQGGAVGAFTYNGRNYRLFSAVVLNPVGDVFVDDRPVTETFGGRLPPGEPARGATNTTLSLTVTDAPLDKPQLERLARMVHTNMAQSIRPFQTGHDGDIHVAVSVGDPAAARQDDDMLFGLGQEASALMRRAIAASVTVANRPIEARRPIPVAAPPQQDRLVVSAVQYPVEYGRSLEQVLTKVEGYVRDARAAGSELVVLPELFMLDLLTTSTAAEQARELETIADTATPRAFDRIREMARANGLSILGGSWPRRVPGKGVVNTAIMAFPDGRSILQDKNYLTPDEKAWGWATGDELKVFDAPWGKTVMLICYDSQFPILSNALAEHRPEVLLVPSMTGANGFERVRRSTEARGVEHYAYSVFTGTVGGIGGEYTARAAVYTPNDTGFPGTLTQGNENQRGQIVTTTLDLAQLRRARVAAAANGLYAGAQQRDATRVVYERWPTE
jgi:predicted amidohydrolase/L-aminopeptidase/D-esterase-like protein